MNPSNRRVYKSILSFFQLMANPIFVITDYEMLFHTYVQINK